MAQLMTIGNRKLFKASKIAGRISFTGFAKTFTLGQPKKKDLIYEKINTILFVFYGRIVVINVLCRYKSKTYKLYI